VGGVVAQGQKPLLMPGVIKDQEFENLLQRSAAIFKRRGARLIQFPNKFTQKQLQILRNR
jgi:hypothetical protein